MDAVGIRPSRYRVVRKAISIAASVAVIAVALPACSSPDRSGADRPGERAAGPESADMAPIPRRPHGPAEFTHLDSAIHRYAADRAGRLPTSLSALVTEKSPDGDHYLASVPNDPWGRPYSYAVVSPRYGAYDLRSYGPDTLPGPVDDVVADERPVPVR